jgi:riboflavin kinase/FMN adenylyltransferase
MAGRTLNLPAVALGKFDALHLGHRALAERACQIAGSACLLSFTGMAGILGWSARMPLVAPSDRARVTASWSGELGAAVSEAQLAFSEIRELDGQAFLALLSQRFQTRVVVVGEDFRGGRDRAMGVRELTPLAAALGMRLEVVPAVTRGGQVVSSSAIRAALATGDCALAEQGLGRPHRLVGVVVQGDGRGRTLGVPTANCAERENQDPDSGVYAGVGHLGSHSFPAAINVGRQPTVGSARPLVVEAHLIGYQGTCYGEHLGLDLISRLRPERRFATLAELTAQINQDVTTAAQVVRLHQELAQQQHER